MEILKQESVLLKIRAKCSLFVCKEHELGKKGIFKTEIEKITQNRYKLASYIVINLLR